MSQGHQYLSAVIKSQNRNFLGRLDASLLSEKPSGGEPISEKAYYDHIMSHVLQFRALPTVATLNSAGMPYADTDQPPPYYLNELKKRRVYNAFKKFYEEMKPIVNNDFDIDQVNDKIVEFSNVVAKIQVSDQYKSLAQIGREIEYAIDSRKAGNPEVFIPFGWETLDELTGGLAGGDLAYFIARPGVGKTNILTYAAHHAWTQGFTPMVLTMEMTDVQISRRLYGLAGQFNPSVIRKNVPEQTVQDKLRSAIAAFDEGPDFHIICGQTKQTVESITALVDELQPDVLYIDAAYLVSMNGPSKSTWEKLAAVSERLKQLAITRNLPIILTVQFNREAAKGKRYELDTIAGSDAIGQLGSVIVSIVEGESPYENTRRTLCVMKNREGGVADFEIHNRFDPPRFDEVSVSERSGGTDDSEPLEL